MSDSPLTPGDVAVLVDGDWPEWRAALEDIRREYGDEGVRALLRRLQEYSVDQGVTLSDALLNTPYINTLSPSEQPHYPGDLDIEKRIENIIRWNAAGRPCLTTAACGAGYLRPRIFGGASQRGATAELSAGARRGRWTVVLPTPALHAEILAGTQRLYGVIGSDVHLHRPIRQVSAASWPTGAR